MVRPDGKRELIALLELVRARWSAAHHRVSYHHMQIGSRELTEGGAGPAERWRSTRFNDSVT